MPTPTEFFKELAEREKRFAPFMTALGQVASLWAEYEASLNMGIWKLANVEKMVGACITSQMIGPGPRFRCLLALLEVRKAPQEILDKFNAHHKDAEKIARQRNRFLHDPMLLDQNTKQIVRMEITADKHVKLGMMDVKVAELKALRTKIGHLMQEFDDLWIEAEAKLPPWPRTQFEQSRGIDLRRTDPGNSS